MKEVTKKKKMDCNISGAGHVVVCVYLPYLHGAVGNYILYGLEHRSRSGVLRVGKLYLSFYKRQRLHQKYFQYSCMDCAAVNCACMHRYRACIDTQKKKVVYRCHADRVYGTQHHLKRCPWNVVSVHLESAVWNGE